MFVHRNHNAVATTLISVDLRRDIAAKPSFPVNAFGEPLPVDHFRLVDYKATVVTMFGHGNRRNDYFTTTDIDSQVKKQTRNVCKHKQRGYTR